MSPGGSASPSGNNQLDNPTPRMFGDTLHLHRSNANAKQVDALSLVAFLYFLCDRWLETSFFVQVSKLSASL